MKQTCATTLIFCIACLPSISSAQSDPSIPLSGNTPNFSGSLIQARERQRQEELDQSRLATEAQNRELTAQLIELQRRELQRSERDTELDEALNGNSEAQFKIGLRYYDEVGVGAPKNNAAALEWFRLAAEQGYLNAQFFSGIMYDIGRGAPKNDAEALKWYLLCARQGHMTCRFNVGVFYLQGRGVSRNDIEALSWLHLAADQGSLDAQKAIEELASIENTSQQIDQAERSERANSLVKDLEALADLHSRGVISDVEFNAAKKRLLDL